MWRKGKLFKFHYLATNSECRKRRVLFCFVSDPPRTAFCTPPPSQLVCEQESGRAWPLCLWPPVDTTCHAASLQQPLPRECRRPHPRSVLTGGMLNTCRDEPFRARNLGRKVWQEPVPSSLSLTHPICTTCRGKPPKLNPAVVSVHWGLRGTDNGHTQNSGFPNSQTKQTDGSASILSEQPSSPRAGLSGSVCAPRALSCSTTVPSVYV